MKFLFILCFIGASVFAQDCPVGRSDYYCVTPEMAPESEVTELDFYQIPMKIISLFQSELTANNRSIFLDAQWRSPFLGAGVAPIEEKFRLMILGGLTRAPGFSLEAYAAVICHELGHLIGGEPFQDYAGSTWASREGQSDYFAASTCLPRYFSSIGYLPDEIPALIEKAGYDFLASIKDFSSETRA